MHKTASMRVRERIERERGREERSERGEREREKHVTNKSKVAHDLKITFFTSKSLKGSVDVVNVVVDVETRFAFSAKLSVSGSLK